MVGIKIKVVAFIFLAIAFYSVVVFASPSVVAAQPMTIANKTNVVISDVKISNPNGPCITISNSTNITIKNSVLGPCKDEAISIEKSTKVLVEKNQIKDVTATGILAVDSTDVKIKSNNLENTYRGIYGVRSTKLQIDYNVGKNNQGPSPAGQFVQFDNVYGDGNRIRCNTSLVDFYPTTLKSTPDIRTEDQINVWQSKGIASDPIIIGYNKLKGGSSFTGSGIMMGDGGGQYITAIGNRVVNPWNSGISVAGGQNIIVENNKIFSNLPNHIANEGMYIRNFSPAIACTNITHRNNQIKWPADDWSTEGWTQTLVANPSNNACSNVSGIETNNLKAPLTEAIFTESIAECNNL